MNDEKVNTSPSPQHLPYPVAPLTLQEARELKQRILHTIEVLADKQ